MTLWSRFGGTHRHEAQYKSVVVHYVMTVEVIGNLDLARSTRRMLDSGIAAAAAWPSERTVRVSKRLRALNNAMRKLRAQWTDYERAKERQSLRDALWFSLRHPRMGRHFFRERRAPRVAADVKQLLERVSLRALLVFTLKHPILSARYILPSVRFKRGSAHAGADGATAWETYEALGDDGDENDGEDGGDPLEPINSTEEFILEQQFVSVVERDSDAQLFAGRDRAEDHFVRVHLQATSHDLLMPDGQTRQTVVMEPRLLLHNSGVAQLTLRVESDIPLTTGQVIDLADGLAPRIDASELPTALMVHSGWAHDASAVAPDGGLDFMRVEHKEPLSMVEVLMGHLAGALTVAGVESGPWMHHPTVFAAGGSCCGPRRWDSRHSRDVTRLALRAQGSAEFAAHVTPPTDLSMRAEHSLYVELGSSLYLQRQGELPDPIEELQTVLVIEYGLLLFMRLQAMEESVAQLRLGDRHLQHAYQRAVTLFSELRQGSLRSGEARTIAARVLAALGAEQIRPTIETALDLAAQAHSTRSAARASQRAWWLAAVGTVIAIIVAVPSVTQILVAAKLEAGRGNDSLAVRTLVEFGDIGFWGPWLLVASVLAAAALTSAVAWIVRRAPRRFRRVHRGFAWPTIIDVVTSPEESDEPTGTAQPAGRP